MNIGWSACAGIRFGMNRRAASPFSFRGLSNPEKISIILTVTNPYHVRMTSISILRNTAALIATNTRQPWLVPQGKVSWMSFCSTSSVWVTAGLKPRNAYNQHQKPSKRLRTIVESNDLPQGLLVSPQVQYDGEEGDPQYPTVIQQVRNHMRKYDDCVVLTRVGNFYEVRVNVLAGVEGTTNILGKLYFEHAEEYGPLLNLKVARRKTNAGDVPMVRKIHGFMRLVFLIDHLSPASNTNTSSST